MAKNIWIKYVFNLDSPFNQNDINISSEELLFWGDCRIWSTKKLNNGIYIALQAKGLEYGADDLFRFPLL